jgi:succinylarginine dihydrolase
VKKSAECGDASACLKLRIPVTRRDRSGVVQKMCPQRDGKYRP